MYLEHVLIHALITLLLGVIRDVWVIGYNIVMTVAGQMVHIVPMVAVIVNVILLLLLLLHFTVNTATHKKDV